jgi:predicted small secreted protein
MTNKMFFAGILSIVLVFSFVLAGCPTDSGNGIDSVNGTTWLAEDEDGGGTNRIIFSDNGWTLAIDMGEAGFFDFTKGTFKQNGKTLTLTTTHLIDMAGGTGEWVEYVENPNIPALIIATLSADEKSFEFTTGENTEIFIKQ